MRRTSSFSRAVQRFFNSKRAKTKAQAFALADKAVERLISDVNNHLATGGPSMVYDLPFHFSPEAQRLGYMRFRPTGDWQVIRPTHAFRDIVRCQCVCEMVWEPTYPEFAKFADQLGNVSKARLNPDGYNTPYDLRYNMDFWFKDEGLWKIGIVPTFKRITRIEDGKIFINAIAYADIDMTCVVDL